MKKCGSLFSHVFSKSCLPLQVLATTIAAANYSISMLCALNFLAHNSTRPVWIIIIPSWRHGNLMKENRKPINHQPSRLCWNQYTLPTKPAFLPKYWCGEAFRGRYDFLVQHEVRWWLSQTFFNGATSYQQLSRGKAFKNAKVQRNLPVCKVFNWNEAVIFTCQHRKDGLKTLLHLQNDKPPPHRPAKHKAILQWRGSLAWLGWTVEGLINVSKNTSLQRCLQGNMP